MMQQPTRLADGQLWTAPVHVPLVSPDPELEPVVLPPELELDVPPDELPLTPLAPHADAQLFSSQDANAMVADVQPDDSDVAQLSVQVVSLQAQAALQLLVEAQAPPHASPDAHPEPNAADTCELQLD
jgi:hypothetical protein